MRCRKSGFKPIKDGVRSFAIHQTFLHKNQLRLETVARSDVFQILEDFVTVAVFLMTKLIAGKSQDNELFAKLVGESVHLGVIPGGRASQRGDILNENYFALEHFHVQV